MKTKYTDMTEHNLVMTLTLEDDSERKCAALCKIVMEENTYMILLPLLDSGEQDMEGDVYFFRFAEDEWGNPILNKIETEEEYLKVADAFDHWLDIIEEQEQR